MYNVKNGRIISQGKFEGEPEWVPHFWNMAFDGMADELYDEENCCTWYKVEVTKEDVNEFPILGGLPCVYLREDYNGFIHSSTNGFPQKESERDFSERDW